MEKTTPKERLREFSAGGVVYKREKNKILWLVTKVGQSSRFFSENVWRLPKGWIDDSSHGGPGLLASGEVKAKEKDLIKAATREVEEEGGVRAKVITKIATIKYLFPFNGKKILKFATFYLMEKVNDLPGGFGDETSEVAWLDFNKARQRLTYSGEKSVLDQAQEILTGEKSKI